MKKLILYLQCLNIGCYLSWWHSTSVVGKRILGSIVKTDYRKLWKLLIDRKMTKSDLRKQAGISSVTLAKLGKGGNVTTDVLLKICITLKCDIADIMEIEMGN